MSVPRNNVEALALGLYLALTAPDEARAQEATALAGHIACRMSKDDVTRAKKKALAMAEAGEVSQ
tara:strand:- start:1860 stop:2054 length:195 start_codon:yes stop_codon:yes gene_type:complete